MIAGTNPSAIVAALVGAVSVISVASGYATDAGQQVFQGRENFGQDDAYPLISINYLEDKREKTYGNTKRRIMSGEFDVAALIKVDPLNPLVAAFQIRADLIRALFGDAVPDRLGLGESLTNFEFEGVTHYPRLNGDDICQVSVRTSAQWLEVLGSQP